MDEAAVAVKASSLQLYKSFVVLAGGLLRLVPLDIALAVCAVAASHIQNSTADELIDASAAGLDEHNTQYVLLFLAIIFVFLKIHLAIVTLVIIGNNKSIDKLAAVSGRWCRRFILAAVILQTITFLCNIRIMDGTLLIVVGRFQRLGGWCYLIIAGHAIFGVVTLAFCCMGSYVALYGH